ncbi:MAG: hypothetical protein Q4A54_04250 [Parabacteroides sp.]|nr:hypothetical protein [Parabacteroides sp.]
MGLFNKKKEWKPGIPRYKESDLLAGRELLNFAMNAVWQHEPEADKYEIITFSDEPGKVPNIVCERDGKTIFIVVKPAIYPDFAYMSVPEKKSMLAHARKFGAECYVALVEIMSTDSERAEAGLALKNDGYYINYTGLEKIGPSVDAIRLRKILGEIKALPTKEEALKEKKVADPGVRYSLPESDIPPSRPNVRFSISEVRPAFDSWNNSVSGKTFSEELISCIGNKGLKNQDFYKAALIDRKLFSAIKNNRFYKPKKETAVACCFGLKLSLDDSKRLLERAGYSLSLAIPWDRIVYYCLDNKIYDLDIVNEILYEENEKCIGV